ncbi:MAG: threonine synthase, partial [Candidatus Korarchaeota archaeon]|nr:threonine synthase [Candidatus Korarchaeota archaeon]NIU84847.1 threonine synthase [Candidatus Thorarchaeota archaeon]NIW14865.1 threonine synthase [Candidatus Thorarchaeota archaeon]NIW52906.1 threonine synthase [Candidatus Korarchaeota archaeon]
YDLLREKRGFKGGRNDIWRFRSLLPLSSSQVVSLGEGFTPLILADGLREKWGQTGRLWLKNESLNPTGSFLDRGASIAITRAKELQVSTVTCGTRGNLGASISAYAARAGLNCELFVPKHLEMEKLYQMTLFGANVRLVDSYETALEKARGSRSSFTLTVEDPYFLEGLKTTAFEIFTQLGGLPDTVVVGVGTGSHLSMMWKGLKELKKLGWCEALPTLVGVQAQAVNPLVKTFRSHTEREETPMQGATIAKDLAFAHPPLGQRALQAVRESGGTMMSVTDDEILRGVQMLAENEGILSEPAGAVPVVATEKLLRQGELSASDEIVMVITGAGLKDHSTIQTLVKRVDKEENITSLMKRQEIVSRIGKTKRLILGILSKGKDYGYHIHQELLQKYNLSVSLPTIYQHLNELTELGLITKIKSQGREKYYLLTEKGNDVVA